MMRRQSMELLTLVFLFFLCVPRSFSDSPRIVHHLNEGWRFYKGDFDEGFRGTLDDSGWEQIHIPHTWNVHDPYDNRDATDGLDITLSYYRGPGWYRKVFVVDGEHRGKRLALAFEGVNAVADVWINEVHVGTHIGGYSGFEFDITHYVKYGQDNLIAVRVDNSYHYDIPPQSADYTMYGGIYRDVYVVETSPVFLKHVLVSTPEVNVRNSKLDIVVPVENSTSELFQGRIEVSISDPRGTRVADTVQDADIQRQSLQNITIETLEIADPILWSPETPHLYNAVLQLYYEDEMIDERSEAFGLRWFRFDPDSGFFLNSEYTRLRGVNRHQDRQGYGNALPNHLHVEDMKYIKTMGANFVRLAHYQQDPAVLAACDSLGLLVWEEIPVVRSVGKEQFAENARRMLEEMITQHFNHPSIIIWGLMNEVIRDQRDEELHWTVDLCQMLHARAKALDPSRYTAQAQFKDRGTDILTVTDIIGFNKYDGWYSNSFSDFGLFVDEMKARYPSSNFIISEYGAGSERGYHVEHPVIPDFSENWQLELHKNYWQQISERKWIAGSAIWNMFDFCSWEKGGNIPHINQKGMMTFDRQPKDVFYFYQGLWTDEPMVYIVSHTWRKRSGGSGELKRIEVFSNCHQVELFLNSQSMGMKRNGPFFWDIRLKEGINYLKAVGRTESKTVEDEISFFYFIVEP